jgi:hypothetical protein
MISPTRHARPLLAHGRHLPPVSANTSSTASASARSSSVSYTSWPVGTPNSVLGSSREAASGDPPLCIGVARSDTSPTASSASSRDRCASILSESASP